MKHKTETNQRTDRLRTTKDNQHSSRQPVLRFSPTAWAELLFFCHRGETKIGGFGLTPPDDLMMVEEFATVKQSVTCVSVAFDDDTVADFFDAQVDAGRLPCQFARIWLHTHPGMSPQPSGTDEETFARVFGTCDWAVMFVLGRGGKRYARLRFSAGPGGEIMISTRVDFGVAFPASDHNAWAAEYDRNIHVEPTTEPGFGHEVRRGTVFDELDERQGFDADRSLTQIRDTEDLIEAWECEGEVWP